MSMPAPKVLITGADGQVGRELQVTVPAGWQVRACGIGELDVTKPEMVRAVLQRERPTLVINTAAYTQVDRAEAEAEQAEAVNALGVGLVTEAAFKIGARLIHLSTDFVFDGARGQPYAPGDQPSPLGVYGRTKLEGERAALSCSEGEALVLRTAWVYSAQGRNFVRTMLRLMTERDTLGVICDQIGTPTWGRSLAHALWRAAALPELNGIYHWTDAGVASWYDFAMAIQEEALALHLIPKAVPIRPLRSLEYPAAARRPSYSVLDASTTWAALGIPVEHWRVNLRRMLQSLADA
jgi:dTDP-4-dehydrorhamnose reductase